MNISYIPPDIRAYLIAEALKFTLAASKLPGVMRIALIGSLTTDKKEPKDADLLVTVTDETDLEPLARIGRKLQGMRKTSIGEVRSSWLIQSVITLDASATGRYVNSVFA